MRAGETRPKHLQERLKGRHHKDNLSSERLEQVDSSSAFPSITRGSVAYQWCHGLLPMHLHVGDWLGFDEANQFCIRLQRAEIGGDVVVAGMVSNARPDTDKTEN